MVKEKSGDQNTWLQQLKTNLGKSRAKIAGAITDTFVKRKVDKVALEDLKDILIQGDLGVSMASELSSFVGSMRFDAEVSGAEIRKILSDPICWL